MKKGKLQKKQHNVEAEAQAPFRWSHKAMERCHRAMSKDNPSMKTWRKPRHEKKRWQGCPTHDMDGKQWANY